MKARWMKLGGHDRLGIVCVADYFLPGFKGGGPIRTLANLRTSLSKDIELAIFTRDRDLGADAPYPGVCGDAWLQAADGPVYYATPAMFGAKGLKQAMSERGFDVLYLNSFFSYRSSISIYLSQRKSGLPILIAPRGEFSPGALALKRHKKWLFLVLARLLSLYRDVAWHASTAKEAEDILRQFPYAKGHIHMASNPVAVEEALPSDFPPKTAGELRIAFISRISPKKNLGGLLEILAGVDRKLALSIFGPAEDTVYWQHCQTLIARLPAHIRVDYRGPITPDEVSSAFAAHDLFVFPTHGENFGHVIFEALRAGTPVLVSDQTPWCDDPSGAITVAPLDSPAIWRRAIETAADMDSEQQQALRIAALDYARRYAASDETRSDNLTMFRAVAGERI